MSEDVKIPGMTPPTCPKCHSAVKPISVWRVSTANLKEPAQALWVCTNPLCLHKWPGIAD